ncbi:hypothetical protein OIN60_20340 [Paenibacillus sp. P96]|uniref:SLH domain-containing protein n=1 Tax=Paenibacillus zeirhizosphaerae TaxID=2987519 RepID=A0ABT9FWS2_9BACL|nr:hypothetical protein [Paenibacillus sp. P96]MDP4099080.1 hypothetical protein [Paenibacillus sp. P96]
MSALFKSHTVSRKVLTISTAFVISTLAATGTPTFAAAPVAEAVVTAPSLSSSKANSNISYLQNRFEVTLPAAPTVGDYITVMGKLLGQTPPFAKDAAPLTQVNAVSLAVKAAELKELADTYTPEKAASSLDQAGVSGIEKLSPEIIQELAAAVDTGLLPADAVGSFRPDSQADNVLAADLLAGVLSFHGSYKSYIGSVLDNDIFAKLNDAYDTQELVMAPELQKIFDEGLKQGLFTGYNIKDQRYDAHFDPTLSLTYGHSDLKHSIQLIGLLRSEGIQAKVQLEPKTSAFVYLQEWGTPTESDDYKVVQIENGNYIAYAKEYDLALEFESAADKEQFDGVVNRYAKKDSEDEAGLITASWWQPLYYSLPSMNNYMKISNNRIDAGSYYAQSFSLKEDTETIAEGLNKIAPEAEVQTYDFWVDAPFYRYLNGESS